MALERVSIAWLWMGSAVAAAIGRRLAGDANRTADGTLGIEAIVMIRRLFAFVLLCWPLGFAWFSLLLPQPFETHRKTDGIVVLTGGAGRIGRGMDLLQAGAATTLLISGVDRAVRTGDLDVAHNPPATR